MTYEPADDKPGAQNSALKKVSDLKKAGAASPESLSTQNKIEAREKRRQLAVDLRRRLKLSHQLLMNDEDFLAMRRKYKHEFFTQWQAGFTHYIKGEWSEALAHFEGTLVRPADQNFYPDEPDGPSNTLLNVINNRGRTAPENWKGFRELTSK